MTEVHEVRISRYLEATPEEVYRAFVEPEQLAQWYGPASMHCPVELIDVDPREGGHWRMTMVGNDDPELRFPLDTTLIEVVENQLLVGYEIARGFPGQEDGTRVTLSIELRSEGSGTRLELRQGPFPGDGAAGAGGGWRQALDKLDRLVATTSRTDGSA